MRRVRLDMIASAEIPGAAVLVLTKPSWHMPARSTVSTVATFSDRISLVLTGTGRDKTARSPMTDATRHRVHEFTAATGGKLTFPGSTEPPLTMDLAGTSAAVNAMSDGVQAAAPSRPRSRSRRSQPAVRVGAARRGRLPAVHPGLRGSRRWHVRSLLAARAVACPVERGERRGPVARGHHDDDDEAVQVSGPWELRWKSDRFFSAVLHRIDREGRQLVANQARAGASSAYQPYGGSYYLKSPRWHGGPPRHWRWPTTADATKWPTRHLRWRPTAASRSCPCANPPKRHRRARALKLPSYRRSPTTSRRTRARPTTWQGSLSDRRAEAIYAKCSLAGEPGTGPAIYKLSSNAEPKNVVEIKIGKDTDVTTWNNSLSDFQDKTLIPFESALFRRVSQLSVGQPVTFSRGFVPDNLDCPHEKSVSVAGAMTEPEFLMRFSDIRAAP